MYGNLSPCPKCGGEAKTHYVGDWKTLYVMKCKECGFTPCKNGDARQILFAAWKMWNLRCKEYEGNHNKHN